MSEGKLEEPPHGCTHKSKELCLLLNKLLPDHSTCVDTTTLVDAIEAQVIHVRVLIANMPPLGTSGVRVVVTIEM